MEEIAFEPPRAKNEAYWKRREVVVISAVESSKVVRSWSWSWKRRNRGTLLMRDWVTRRRESREWKEWRSSGLVVSVDCMEERTTSTTVVACIVVWFLENCDYDIVSQGES